MLARILVGLNRSEPAARALAVCAQCSLTAPVRRSRSKAPFASSVRPALRRTCKAASGSTDASAAGSARIVLLVTGRRRIGPTPASQLVRRVVAEPRRRPHAFVLHGAPTTAAVVIPTPPKSSGVTAALRRSPSHVGANAHRQKGTTIWISQFTAPQRNLLHMVHGLTGRRSAPSSERTIATVGAAGDQSQELGKRDM